ncbi:hypothetical protein PFICI_05934 [Pestalotiopsis fici W106-1]|uniref:Uncharacterized protein n=1 Tax=Pestalotiopsis fici (strain W106-1 / CGMCC3.15140) TaxID=1229662 RepID=W3XD83_PESFW|nr:uncharacterized protein PFICI_05934 [Pestalotiopsis fici W106-1]ETS84058.1 hypothetical protein PFICI_05934 [Pestalotiopsis fici W106-1]
MSAFDELAVPQLRSIAQILDLKPGKKAKKPAILGSINKHLGTGADPKYEEWTCNAALAVAKARGLTVAEQDKNNIEAIAAVMRAADDLQPQTRSKSPIRLDGSSGSSGSSSPATVIHQPHSGSPPSLASEAEAGAGSSSAGAEPAKRGRGNSPSQVGGVDNASDSAQNPNKKPEITAGERPVESDANMSEADAADPAAVQAKTLHDKATDHADKAIKNALKSKSVTNPQESEAALTEAQKEAELAKASAQALNSQKTADQDQKEHANASAAIAAGVTANANAEHQRQPSTEAASEQAGPSQIPAPVEIPGNKGASGVGPLVVARKGGDKEFLSSVKPTNLSRSGQKFLQEAEAFLRAASTGESTVISNFRDTLSPSKPRDASAPSAETTPDKDSEPAKTSEIYVHPPNETKWKASEFSWEDHFESITIVPAPDLNKPNPNRPRLGFTDVGPFTNDPERWVNFADPWTGQRYDGFVLNISKKQQLMVEYGGNSNARQSRGVMLPAPSYRQQRTQFEKWLKKGTVEIQHGHEEDLAGLKFRDLDIDRCIVFEFLTPSEYDLRDADVRVLIRTTLQSEESHNQFYTRSQLERTLGSAMKQWIQENRPTPQHEHAADNKMERKANRGSKRSGKQDHDMSQRLLRLEDNMDRLVKLLMDTHA